MSIYIKIRQELFNLYNFYLHVTDNSAVNLDTALSIIELQKCLIQLLYGQRTHIFQ